MIRADELEELFQDFLFLCVSLFLSVSFNDRGGRMETEKQLLFRMKGEDAILSTPLIIPPPTEFFGDSSRFLRVPCPQDSSHGRFLEEKEEERARTWSWAILRDSCVSLRWLLIALDSWIHNWSYELLTCTCSFHSYPPFNSELCWKTSARVFVRVGDAD